MDPKELAGAGNDDQTGQHAADIAPVAPVAPVAPKEPSMAEIIAEQLGQVTAHIDERFKQYDTKLDELKPKAEPTAAAAWQPKTWDDFPALVEQKGEEAARRILKERDDAVASANAEAAQTQKQIDDHIDGQVVELEKAGKLPAITDAASATDPGKLARQELFGFAAYLGTPNLASAHATLEALHASGNKFDYNAGQVLRGAQPNPGKNAPIGSSSAAGGSVNSNRPTYKDIANLDTAELLRRFPNG